MASFKEKVLKPEPRCLSVITGTLWVEGGWMLVWGRYAINTEAAGKVGFHTLTLTTGAASLETALRTIPEIDQRLVE